MSVPSLEHLGNLKLKELEVFYLAAKTKSIREVARRLKTTPGQISKLIQSVERKMKTTLFKRSNFGIVLSETGAQLVLLSEEILESAYKIESLQQKQTNKIVAVAATSFLINYLVAPAAVKDKQTSPPSAFRFLDLAPDQMISAGLRGAFEIAFHLGRLDWPQTWLSEKIGKIEWVLCVRANHPLKKQILKSELLQYPFISPTYWTSEGLMKGNDFFPVPVSKRKAGHETSAADTAIPILRQTDQIAFLPSLLIASQVESGKLRVLRLKEIEPVFRDLYVSVKTDAVKAAVFEAIKFNVSQFMAPVLTK